MVEPLDRESRSFRLITECFSQQLDKPHAFFNGSFAVIFLANLRAFFIARPIRTTSFFDNPIMS